MPFHGLLRVAACSPTLRVGDCAFNADQTLETLRQAQVAGVEVAVFPELGLTGYTCNDLFHQQALLRSARESLVELAAQSGRSFDGLAVVGLPMLIDDQVFNCAAAFARGRILGIVPKTHLPNYKEFYDARYFAAAASARSSVVNIGGQPAAFGADLLFVSTGDPDVVLGIEICEDLWVPDPPSSRQALAGANVLVNLSASNEVIGKVGYRRQLVASQSGRCIAAYVYSSSGVHESTTDLVFGGHCLIAENGSLLTESPRFARAATMLEYDVDLGRLRTDRLQTNTFAARQEGLAFRRIAFELSPVSQRDPKRTIDAHPFVPQGEHELKERCDEIFHIQVAGLAKRLEHIGTPLTAIGVSGGLDSTLALLVVCKTMDALGAPRSRIQGVTMPGFGTTSRTKTNAIALMRHLGVSTRETDIRPLCLAEWKALGHKPFGIALEGLDVEGLTAKLRDVPNDRRSDLVFENVQARIRTNLLMNTGFVIGTGDLSELALGWCTYNADHMSMYNVNVSVPKTLVKFLVAWAAKHEFDGDARRTLDDIVGTVISPELLPPDSTGAIQSTEGAIGPYELHDFFLYHIVRTGASPARILYLARHAQFDRTYSNEQMRHWLRVFLTRFFANQFKRSCLPDGPKVGTVSLSPRGDWRMPSDAAATTWLADI